jgi:hypothetical protein
MCEKATSVKVGAAEIPALSPPAVMLCEMPSAKAGTAALTAIMPARERAAPWRMMLALDSFMVVISLANS